jgi:hypothetical protein
MELPGLQKHLPVAKSNIQQLFVSAFTHDPNRQNPIAAAGTSFMNGRLK